MKSDDGLTKDNQLKVADRAHYTVLWRINILYMCHIARLSLKESRVAWSDAVTWITRETIYVTIFRVLFTRNGEIIVLKLQERSRQATCRIFDFEEPAQRVMVRHHGDKPPNMVWPKL